MQKILLLFLAIALATAFNGLEVLGLPNPYVCGDRAQEKKDETPSQDRFQTSPTTSTSKLDLILPRGESGDGDVAVNGETKVWHKLSLDLSGPWAHEQDNKPNPFLDFRFEGSFTHSDGTQYSVPGFFAADGNAAESSADSGNMWRVNFVPDCEGVWKYELKLFSAPGVAVAETNSLKSQIEKSGEFTVAASDKTGRDFRRSGRLQHVGKRYLQHAGSKKWFLKFGTDSPETLLAYQDFDGTVALNSKKAPLKSFQPHVADWVAGDPVWKKNKGKGLIGAVNYLSKVGCNAFSFLTYNAGGDGDNVWPYVARDDKLHFDCSKLDQWGIVFDHATTKGMFLHFKLQETEIDDHRAGAKRQQRFVKECLDGGNLGVQRKLYLRELIARFGHNLACNWNLGEENSMTHAQQADMSRYIRSLDSYGHPVVVHTYPNQQDEVYGPFLGQVNGLDGLSLQNNSLGQTHRQTVKWVRKSQATSHHWIVSFDEAGSATHGQTPDVGYQDFQGVDSKGKRVKTVDNVRRRVLWGHLMGGGAGVEYYFGYLLPQNDLLCEDWRSREQSWKYCKIAGDFFRREDLPLIDLQPMDELIGNKKLNNDSYCLATPGKLYLIYLPTGGGVTLDLSEVRGKFRQYLFDPRTGGAVIDAAEPIEGGKKVKVESGKTDGKDWLVILVEEKIAFGE